MKISFIYVQTKLIFIWRAFALSLALIMRFTATRKWTNWVFTLHTWDYNTPFNFVQLWFGSYLKKIVKVTSKLTFKTQWRPIAAVADIIFTTHKGFSGENQGSEGYWYFVDVANFAFLHQVVNFNTTLLSTSCVPSFGHSLAYLIPQEFLIMHSFAPPLRFMFLVLW